MTTTVARTAWERGRFDARDGPRKLLFGHMYEDASIECRAFRPRGRELLATAGYHAVAFDARGHGDSEWAYDGRYDHDIVVDDLECVLAALGNQRPALVGASMGGGTSLVAVGEDPGLHESASRCAARGGHPMTPAKVR